MAPARRVAMTEVIACTRKDAQAVLGEINEQVSVNVSPSIVYTI
jgi:hypothetical protein